MKIICICKKNDPRCLGGIETFERNLMKIFGKNIRFYVFNNEKEKIFLGNNIVNIQEVKSITDKFLLKILGKTRYMKYRIIKENPDIIIFNKPKDIRLFKNTKFKKILIQHKDLETYKKEVFENKKFFNLIKKEVDKYVVLSAKSKELFQKYFKIDNSKVIIIRHSCEIPLLENKKVKNKKLIIVSRLENKQKRIDLAIKVMKKLPEYTLNIYGDGPDEKMLKDLTKEEGLAERVFFYGKTNKVQEKLDAASIFIMTSDWEGYGITNIEAMTRGLPIVLRNTFESAEEIIQGNGVLLSKEWNEEEFIEAINNIYNNYEIFSQKSLELAKKYRFEIIAEKWKKIVENKA